MDLYSKLYICFDLLKEYKSFIDQDDSIVLTDFEKRFHHPWYDKYHSLSEELKMDFDAFRKAEVLDDKLWVEAYRQMKEIFTYEKVSISNPTQYNTPPGKKKKQHELIQLREYFKNLDVSSFVDFGGGVGNTAFYFQNEFALASTVVEMNPELIKSGEKKFLNKIQFINSNVDRDFNLSKVNSNTLGFGLHTCGSFAVDMIRASFKSEFKHVLNFGCCYSKICEDNFLCSNHSKKFPVEYNQRALSAATLSFTHTEKELYKFRQRIIDYKMSFYHYIYKEFGIMKFLPMSNSRRSLYNLDYAEFFKMSFEKFYPDFKTPSMSQVNDFYLSKENRQVIEYFNCYYSFSRYFGELVENFILLDRAIFGIENGYSVTIKEVFDPKVSPRNKGLFFKK